MTTSDRRHLAALQAEQLKRAAERSLRAFVEQAWPILEPTTPFLPNWHIDLLCDYLEAVTAGECARLVINMPPRYGKSLIVSVCWPVWAWIRRPESRWVFTSYAEALAVQHSLDRRTLLLSPWYQGSWGRHVQLTDQNEKTEYWNSRRGRMLATSIGGTVTGKGGNHIVVDDPHTPRYAESDTVRQHAIEYFLRTLVTRLDDKRLGTIVVVMQRLRTGDLTATCLDLGYTHLCLPAVAEMRTTHRFLRSARAVTREIGDLAVARAGRARGDRAAPARTRDLRLCRAVSAIPEPAKRRAFQTGVVAPLRRPPEQHRGGGPVVGPVSEGRCRARLCRVPCGGAPRGRHLSHRSLQGSGGISGNSAIDPEDVRALPGRPTDSGRRHCQWAGGDRDPPTRDPGHHPRAAQRWEIRAGVGLCASHRGRQCLPAAPDGAEWSAHP